MRISLDTYTVKFLNIIRYTIFLLIHFILTLQKQKKSPKTLLLIRLDSIGDYLLMHNFIPFVKNSGLYKNYKVTLCGNIVWKDLAETFDAKWVDKFIWLDRKKFNNNVFYKYKLLRKIYKSSFEVVCDTTYSREILFGDSIVKVSNAATRIGSTGFPDTYVKWKRNLLTDKFYTRLIKPLPGINFEFYQNKDFFEKFLITFIELIKPELAVDEITVKLPTRNEFIVVFPGGQEKQRRWSVENYSLVVQMILKEYNYDIIIAGSKAEESIAKQLVHCFNKQRVYNITGTTTLPQLAKLISISKLLISNETSAVHFAASVNTPFVCISNGQRFGRFMPYPSEMNVQGVYLYPEEIESKLNNYSLLAEKYRFGSDLDINSIKAEKVIKIIRQLL